MGAFITAQQLNGMDGQTTDGQQCKQEARSKYLEWIEKERTKRDHDRQMKIKADEERLREETRRRFLLVNPNADELDFQVCWQAILDELSNQRAAKLLREKGALYIPT